MKSLFRGGGDRVWRLVQDAGNSARDARMEAIGAATSRAMPGRDDRIQRMLITTGFSSTVHCVAFQVSTVSCKHLFHGVLKSRSPRCRSTLYMHYVIRPDDGCSLPPPSGLRLPPPRSHIAETAASLPITRTWCSLSLPWRLHIYRATS